MRDGASPSAGDVDVSEHAVEHYRQRLRPALELPAARVELARLLSSGEVVAEAPAWTRSAQLKPFCLGIGDALALALAPQRDRWVTTTCLVQATLTAPGATNARS